MGSKIGRERQRLILSASRPDQQEKWLEELDIQKSENAAVAESASRSKIQPWKTISGRAIVSSEKLLEKLDESVSCRLPGKSPSHGKCSD